MDLGSSPAGRRGPGPGPLALAVLVVAGAVALAFRPAFDAGFLSFDDPENFARNFQFRGLGAAQLDWMVRTGHMGHYQPLAWLSLALDWVRGGAAAGGGLEPGPFHVSNLILHALGALAVGRLALTLLERTGPPEHARIGALVAALLFAVHPLRVESVVWVTERRDVLSAPFFVLALWAWLRRGSTPADALTPARLSLGCLVALSSLALFFASVSLAQPGRLGAGALGLPGLFCALAAWATSLAVLARGAGARWFVLAALLLLVSLAAKAWGIVVPALLLVLDAWPLRRATSPRAWLRLVAEKAPFWTLAVAFAALASWAQASQVQTLRSLRDHGLVERACQAAYGLVYYVARTLWPVRLSPIYELPEDLAASEPRFALALLAVLAAGAALIALRRRAPWALAALAAYGVMLSPVLGVLQSGPQLVADRYSYLACLPLVLLAGAGLQRGLGRARARVPLLLASALLLLISAWATNAYARLWTSSRVLWEHAVLVQPESPLARLSLGSALHEQGGVERDPARKRAFYEEARAHFERGLQLEPRQHQPRLLGSLALVEGALAELDPATAAEHRARALEYSSRSLALAAERGAVEQELRLNHGVHLFNAGRTREALGVFEAVVRARPQLVIARERYGLALLAEGQPQRAAAEFERVLALEPGNQRAQALLREARRVGGR